MGIEKGFFSFPSQGLHHSLWSFSENLVLTHCERKKNSFLAGVWTTCVPCLFGLNLFLPVLPEGLQRPSQLSPSAHLIREFYRKDQLEHGIPVSSIFGLMLPPKWYPEL